MSAVVFPPDVKEDVFIAPERSREPYCIPGGEPVFNWRPPYAEVGDLVHYYRDIRGNAAPSFGWILEAGMRANRIVTIQGMRLVEHVEVSHRLDPRLKANQEHANRGCWDFHPTLRELWEVKERLAELEKLNTKFEPVRFKKLEDRTDGMSKYVDKQTEHLEGRVKAIEALVNSLTGGK